VGRAERQQEQRRHERAFHPRDERAPPPVDINTMRSGLGRASRRKAHSVGGFLFGIFPFKPRPIFFTTQLFNIGERYKHAPERRNYRRDRQDKIASERILVDVSSIQDRKRMGFS
jgi:hypothetical protein